MSYIGNSPGVSSQRVVTEEVISGSPKSAFYPVGGYALGYVDVLINGLEVDSSDFTATDGVVVTLGTAAAVGDTVKIKAYIPRGLSDGYLKSEADARYPRVDTASQGLTSTEQGNARTNIGAQAALGYTPVNKAGDTMTGDLVIDNGSADGAQVIFKSAGSSDWNLDNYNGKLRAYNGATERLNVDTSGNLTLLTGNLVLASGKGIDFSATANSSGTMTSELFDDYEVGTWTPIYVQAGGNPTVSYIGTFGIYRKIGSLVWVSGRINTASVSGGSGMVSLGGLPYTVANVGNDNSALTIGVSFSTWNTNAAPASGYPTTGTTTIQLTTFNGADPRNGLDARINALNSTNGANGIVFSCMYIAA